MKTTSSSNYYYNYIFVNPEVPKITHIPEFNLTLEYEPIYVGKGKDNRWRTHLNPSSKRDNKWKYDLFMRLHASYNLENYVVLIEGISEGEALDNEEKLISTIGTKKQGTGSLLNLLKGGRGESPNFLIGEHGRLKARETFRKKVENHRYMVVIDLKNNNKIGEFAIKQDLCDALGWEFNRTSEKGITACLKGYVKEGTKSHKCHQFRGYKIMYKQFYDPCFDYKGALEELKMRRCKIPTKNYLKNHWDDFLKCYTGYDGDCRLELRTKAYNIFAKEGRLKFIDIFSQVSPTMSFKILLEQIDDYFINQLRDRAYDWCDVLDCVIRVKT